MDQLTTFQFDTAELRTFTENGEPWFVAADVAQILGYRMASDMTRRLDDDDKGTRSVRTPSGVQVMTVISEPGLYTAILRSHVPGAQLFQRWVTRDLLPQIRRTGGYQVPELTEVEVARRYLDALVQRDEARAALEAITPLADVGASFLCADGDYSVAETAKILSREEGVETGERRLFDWLSEHGWIVRHGGRPAPEQSRITRCHMRVRATTYTHPRTGETIVGAPQVRITPRGIELIARAMRREARSLAVIS